MLAFEKQSQKVWNVIVDENGSTFPLELQSSSVTNKFEIITTFLTNLSNHLHTHQEEETKCLRQFARFSL